jgi:hypothetical protein
MGTVKTNSLEGRTWNEFANNTGKGQTGGSTMSAWLSTFAFP